MPDAAPMNPEIFLPPKGLTADVEGTSTIQSRHMVVIDSIINWMLANPGKPLSRCAAALELSAPFVYKITSTDSFRARYNSQSGAILEGAGIASLVDKINTAAHLTVERLIEKIPTTESIGELRDTADVLLDRIYGPGGSSPGSGSQAPGVVVPISILIEQQREGLLRGQPAVVIDAPTPEVRADRATNADLSLQSPGPENAPLPE